LNGALKKNTLHETNERRTAWPHGNARKNRDELRPGPLNIELTNELQGRATKATRDMLLP